MKKLTSIFDALSVLTILGVVIPVGVLLSEFDHFLKGRPANPIPTNIVVDVIMTITILFGIAFIYLLKRITEITVRLCGKETFLYHVKKAWFAIPIMAVVLFIGQGFGVDPHLTYAIFVGFFFFSLVAGFLAVRFLEYRRAVNSPSTTQAG